MTLPTIYLYSCGDSTLPRTWSNVPFLFAKTLEEKGAEVIRVNIAPDKFLNKWYNRLNYLIFQRIFKCDACPVFARSWVHRWLIHRKLRRIARTQVSPAINLFLSYAFLNKYSSAPNILWCDWTDAIVIERLGRSVKSYEKKSLQHETQVMKSADVIYTLFPECKRKMEEMYGRQIRHLNRNVVNTLCSSNVQPSRLYNDRLHSDSILFIGNQRYLSGLQRLIAAVSLLNDEGHHFHVDVIGMNRNLMPDAPSWVRFHGYLDKGNPTDCDEYYRLIFNARMLCNPTPGWAAYSSIIEGMYYGLPVAIAPFDDFVIEFGRNISFGRYISDDAGLRNAILDIMTSPDYLSMAASAHEAVKDYTWSKYVDVFLQDLHRQLNASK